MTLSFVDPRPVLSPDRAGSLFAYPRDSSGRGGKGSGRACGKALKVRG
jgi:hypothetical protein